MPKGPPEIIEEIPPDQRPEGDNVTWIPGYWGWDDDRSDYLWVSGIWRALPPGRQWVPGYWDQSGQGYQWSSGYWAEATATEAEYLPQPPRTIERGPNIAAPSANYGWVPGCWIWHQQRYAWRPGYWAEGRADWVWIPSHYVSARRGYVYSDGYWDYSIQRRGILYAPVYFEPAVYSRPNYSYAPTIVINLAIFADQLFLRPSYHHYYFGDYYAPSYRDSGFYASFSFSSDHYGYDPFYSHERWEHRRDHDWDYRVQEEFRYRRDHEDARPPRTFAIQNERNSAHVTDVSNSGDARSNQRNIQIAMPMDQIGNRKDHPVHLHSVAKEEKQIFEQRGHSLQNVRKERQQLESGAGFGTDQHPGGSDRPAHLKMPKSTIESAPVNQLSKEHSPPNRPAVPNFDRRQKPHAEHKSGIPADQPDIARPEQIAKMDSPKSEDFKSEKHRRVGTDNTNEPRPLDNRRGRSQKVDEDRKDGATKRQSRANDSAPAPTEQNNDQPHSSRGSRRREAPSADPSSSEPSAPIHENGSKSQSGTEAEKAQSTHESAKEPAGPDSTKGESKPDSGKKRRHGDRDSKKP
ncbi:YXWGXW repeat-containing protein [Candidatus Sumerlaeota bacterium]|nr:YXWGXW repeat-containing protein [Candidatus Sumerlaeota bacterium]